MNTPALEVTDLHKSYGAHKVVAGIHFTLQRGECYGLLGPNGAGKTTTLRCCLGLTAPDRGSIRLVGQAVPQQAREARSRVGVVPQFDNLDPDFSVAENLLVFGRYFGLKDATTRSRIPALLDFAGLAGKERAHLSSLSGGMKRRLTLARALINDPDLLLLDEPTTGLDPQARHLIWERLKRLLQQGKTILLTTHFMDEAERLCDRLAILDGGHIVAEDSPQALVARHIEPQVIELYGDAVPPALLSSLQALATRIETSGETTFCYASEAQLAPLLAACAQIPGLRILHRRANLEDIFLKLTGRELRD
ncbi:MAG: ATP-binding cassette domain-containing protein [Sterolibacterium sp.]|nr:ATP-binding cassette domain-containing protein [Sterolibacterium sp.]MBP9798657.1 ATP-binding cassette domain-containing protein [Sterolibacterium sp.]